MRTEIGILENEARAVDLGKYIDEDERMLMKEKDDVLLIRASKSRLAREIGLQVKEIDIRKNIALSEMQQKLMQLQTAVLDIKREMENIIKNANLEKAVVRHKKFFMKK
jgi:hypothetical protein